MDNVLDEVHEWRSLKARNNVLSFDVLIRYAAMNALRGRKCIQQPIQRAGYTHHMVQETCETTHRIIETASQPRK